MLDADACYRAIQARDARFDGHFFTGVRSTGVYCRPVCPATTPHRRNCAFYASAAGAQEAGYRPCLRCRPEVAPDLPAWSGTSATVTRAMRMIADGALDGGSVSTLADRLGIGDRHLRRLFLEHAGATPIAVAQTRRVLFAKKLLSETRLPVLDVASAAGFSSLRRFNDAVQSVYHRPPRDLRKSTGESSAGPLTLKLAYRPPYRWDALISFLKARAIPGVESITDDCYRRSVRLGRLTGTIEVRPLPGENYLSVRIAAGAVEGLREVVERVRRLFDLHAGAAEIAAHLREDPLLRPAVETQPGFRLPGAFDAFELSVRAILGQQISVAAATTLAGRIVERWGEPISGSDLRVFPEPARLIGADLASIGLPRKRAEALSKLAAAVAEDRLFFESYSSLDELVTRLCNLDGVGPWTAHYIAMRACGEPDAFPASDLVLRRAAGNLSEAGLIARAERWRPWRAYAAMYLWNAAGGNRNGTSL